MPSMMNFWLMKVEIGALSRHEYEQIIHFKKWFSFACNVGQQVQ